MKIFLSLSLALMTYSCSTDSEYVPKTIDTEIKEIGKTEDGKYGYNKDGEVIIQNEGDPAYDLMIAKKVNQNLFLELERDSFALDHCVQEYSDPSLRGDGKFKKVDDYESLRPTYDETEELGVNKEGELKVVKRSYLKKQLVEAKSQKKTLKKTLRFVQSELRKCETELKYLKSARDKAK